MTSEPDATVSSGDAQVRRRPRFAKGRRPFFMRDPDADRLLAMVTALCGEVWVLRERLDTAERLAAEGRPATPANIEAYKPDPAVDAAREKMRAELLNRVFRILAHEQQDPAAERQYQSIVDEFS